MNANLRGDLTIDIKQIPGIGKLLSKPSGDRKEPERPPGIPDDKKDREKDADQVEKEEEQDEKGEDEEEEKGEDEEEEKGEGEPGKGISMPNPLIAMKKILYVFNSIKPIQGSFSTDKRLNRSGLYERPGWMYTLGFADKPNVRQKVYTGIGTNDQTTFTNDYSLRTGITPVNRLDITTSYKIRHSVNRASNTPVETKSVDFPSLDATLSGLEKLLLFKSVVKTASFQSGYSRKMDESGNPDTGELNEKTIAKSYIPLVGLNLTFNKGIRTTVRYEFSNRKKENLRLVGNQRIDHSEDKTIKVSVSYTLTAPQGLRIPFLGKVKFDSQLSLSLDYMKKFRKSWYMLEGNKNVDVESIDTSIEPKAAYRFSTKITGGLSARWVDTDDKAQQRKRHIRELGIWTELRF